MGLDKLFLIDVWRFPSAEVFLCLIFLLKKSASTWFCLLTKYTFTRVCILTKVASLKFFLLPKCFLCLSLPSYKVLLFLSFLLTKFSFAWVFFSWILLQPKFTWPYKSTSPWIYAGWFVLLQFFPLLVVDGLSPSRISHACHICSFMLLKKCSTIFFVHLMGHPILQQGLILWFMRHILKFPTNKKAIPYQFP